MLLGAFRGGNPLERIVGNAPTEIEAAWASAQGSNWRFSSNDTGLLNFRFERVVANSFIQALEFTDFQFVAR